MTGETNDWAVVCTVFPSHFCGWNPPSPESNSAVLVTHCGKMFFLVDGAYSWNHSAAATPWKLLAHLTTPCSPYLISSPSSSSSGSVCHLGRTDMDPSHVVSGCCGVGLDPNACQIECQKECQIECQNKCQIECQIEGQSMCQIECQLVGITRRM